jgi:VIT1/CCC1 family predicted Fe2+/Mn2+ transporter
MQNPSIILNHNEPHKEGGATASKLNWLRAAVLGANDGIVSVASIIIGVASASNNLRFIFTAGVAGLVAGGMSMALGEYVSVSTQRDTEKAFLEKERLELLENPEGELAELALLYKAKGLTEETAQLVAKELTLHDAFSAHVDIELGIDPNNLTNPWRAALASATAFFFGGIIPLIIAMVLPESIRILVTFIGVLGALVLTGTLSAKIGGSNYLKAIIRVIGGGVLAMAITFGIGKLLSLVSL